MKNEKLSRLRHRLVLKREDVRNLSIADLARVVGGVDLEPKSDRCSERKKLCFPTVHTCTVISE